MNLLAWFLTSPFWQSCMDEDAINSLGTKPLTPWLAKVEEVKDMRSLTSFLAFLGEYDNGAFFGWSVSNDSRNPERRALHLSPGGMTLPDRKYYISNDLEYLEHRAVEKGVIQQLLVNAGVDAAQAEVDAFNVIAIETRTAELRQPHEEARSAEGVYVSRDELKAREPAFYWDDFFAALQLDDVGLEGGSPIVLHDNHFFSHGLSALLENPNPEYAHVTTLSGSGLSFGGTAGLEYVAFDKSEEDHSFDPEDAKILQSYLRYTIVSTFMGHLPEKTFGDVMKPMLLDLYGLKERPPRLKKCIRATNSAMGGHVSKAYVEKYFPEANREAAVGMLENIRGEFKADLETLPWMDDATRLKAVNKLDNMVFEVGYPTRWPHWCDLGELNEKQFLENYVKTEKCRVKRELQKLKENVDRREWSTGVTTINAYYSQKVNGLFIPAAVLNKPFFSPSYPSARNYGSIGAVLGHEMTHGFDDQGRKFDATGERRKWWDKETENNFDTRAKCISDQFSGYTLHGKPVSGELTLGEDIADGGGLKMSYKAWKGAGKRSPAEERIFFLSFGQTWCGVERKETEETMLFDVHAPRKWRVLGTLANNEDFSRAYDCPVGSVLNPGPEKRCKLW